MKASFRTRGWRLVGLTALFPLLSCAEPGGSGPVTASDTPAADTTADVAAEIVADAAPDATADTTPDANTGDAAPEVVAAVVPDPGNSTSAEFADVEPNDTPEQATPVGLITGPVWMGFSQPETAMNTDTDVDYFVFRTGAQDTLASVFIEVCGYGMQLSGDLLNLYLYEVVNSKVGAEIASATDGGDCETLIPFGSGPDILVANATYLLKVEAGPDLQLGGQIGLYGA